jgi:hypothetical protein
METFMVRDPSLYPHDENGDVLWNIAQSGDDLSFRREIDFAVVFPTEDAALTFGAMVLKDHLKVQVSSDQRNREFPWQVYVYPNMEPTHENITSFESMIGARAAEVGGRNDGWAFET